MPLVQRHNSASNCPTRPSVASTSVGKASLDCPTWVSVRRQAQTGGRITRAQFVSGFCPVVVKPWMTGPLTPTNSHKGQETGPNKYLASTNHTFFKKSHSASSSKYQSCRRSFQSLLLIIL